MPFLPDKNGITLTEILIATTIVAIGILPVVGLLSNQLRDTVIIESNRYAQERGMDIMLRIMNEVPFEVLLASTAKNEPGGMKAQGKPSSVNGIIYNEEWVKKEVKSIFPASEGATYYIASDSHGVAYEFLLEITDIVDPTPNKFSGSDYNAPNTWQELYFDAYQLPEFYTQKNWKNQTNIKNNGAINKNYITPYQYYGNLAVGRLWGPAQRLKNGVNDFAQKKFPRDQKDVSKPWPEWNNVYCTVKKLRLRIRWNIDNAFRGDPTKTTTRSREVWFAAFKADIM